MPRQPTPRPQRRSARPASRAHFASTVWRALAMAGAVWAGRGAAAQAPGAQRPDSAGPAPPGRVAPHTAAADSAAPRGAPRVVGSGVRIDLHLADLPYNVRFGGRAPSMQQSLALTAGFYDAAHLGIERAFGPERRTLGRLTIAGFDLLSIWLPPGDAWLHEEWHRAVLGHRGVGSFNDVYRFEIGGESIAVSHARDEDLARLKREHPAESVRLKAAGIEAEYQMVTRLERDQFFRGGRAWHPALYWLTTLGAVLYVSDTSETDAMHRADNARERTVAERDILGHDFTAWVRDLFRPAEPWEARGVHPSGVGVNRYVNTTDLTPEERRYLHRQGRLAFLNFADPHLLGIRGFTLRSPVGGGPLRANLALRHLLTSFGHTVDANVFLKQGPTNLFVVLHGYANRERGFLPGADVELVDHAVTVFGRPLELSPRLAVWAQPSGQRFRTRAVQGGGLAGLRVRHALRGGLSSLTEVEAKTAGWVAGVVQLERAVNVRVGGSAGLP